MAVAILLLRQVVLGIKLPLQYEAKHLLQEHFKDLFFNDLIKAEKLGTELV